MVLLNRIIMDVSETFLKSLGFSLEKILEFPRKIPDFPMQF